jgi:hypothetical protein
VELATFGQITGHFSPNMLHISLLGSPGSLWRGGESGNIEHTWGMYNKPAGCSTHTPAYGAPHNKNNTRAPLTLRMCVRHLRGRYLGSAFNRSEIIKHFNPFNAQLNPIRHLLALLGDHPIHHVSRIRVNLDARRPAVFQNEYKHQIKYRYMRTESHCWVIHIAKSCS